MNHSNAIAVIGMSCRFPGARNIEQFWENLKNGIESVTRFSDQELTEAGVPPSQLNHPDYVRSGFILEGEDLFDASFFGYSPREAEIMDPQQRLFLETAWKALEDGGYGVDQYDGSIGVFAGSRMSSYLANVMDSKALTLGDSADLQLLIANDKDYLTSRVSFKLNLRGPSITVQSACSTSLVAVHLACDSLFLGACDMALAGGVSLNLPQKRGYLFQEGMVLSPDGHCRVFDARANGMVPGNGVGVVLLKRLEEALADRDPIQAVITGSAVNNDGSHKVGYTTPSVTGQLEVIREAQGVSGVSPDSISYIEAHGTGTVLGDPVETEALGRVFGEKTGKKGFCAIGSVKTNIGHLDTAAGIAGFIKTVLCLQHGYLVPSLNYEQPNPKIDFQNSPFYVNTRFLPWQANGYPRRAGVSSFGFGGTNAHVILEEAPGRPVTQTSHFPLHLLTLSAKTREALNRQIHNFCLFLENNPDALPEDICFTANTGRSHFPYRFAAIAASTDDLHQKLYAATQGNPSPTLFQGHTGDGITPEVTFDVPARAVDHDWLAHLASDSHTLQTHYHLPLAWADRDGDLLFLSALGKLYVHGATIDWEGFYHNIKPHRISLPTYPFDHKRYWKPGSSHNNTSITDRFLSKTIWDHFNGTTADYADQYDLSNMDADNTIEKISVFYFSLALQSIGAFSSDDHVFTADELADKFGISPAHRQLLTRLLNALVHHKMLQKTKNKYHHLEPVSIQMVWNALEELNSGDANPEGLAELIQACGENFGDVLKDIKNHREIVFLEGSIEPIENLYVNSPQAVFLNSVIRKIASEITSLMPPENALRVLEIGAGTGATTRAVLPGLNPRSRYTFTDISSSFLNKAEEKFQAYPFMTYKILDIEKPPGAQGFENASFDLIIASNVLHATKNMDQTLSHIQALLAPGGVLLIREITRYIPQLDLVFGPLLTQLDDGKKRDAEPFLSIENWKKLLMEHQFVEISAFPGHRNGESDIGEHILAARTDAQTKTDHIIPAFNCKQISQTDPQSVGNTDDHPLLGRLFYVPSGITHQNQISLSSLPPSLRDHRIFEEIVLPGGYFFEMALSAGKKYLHQLPVLKKVMMHEALVLEPDDSPITVQTILSQENPGKFSCEIYSTPESKPMQPKHWKRHFSGTLERHPDALSGSGIKLAEIEQRCIKSIEPGDHIPVNAVVHDVRLGKHEAIGQITFPETIIRETIDYAMPPAFLDPCLLMWSAILDNTLDHEDGDTSYLPVAVDQVCYFSKAPEELRCHVVLRDPADKNNLMGNINLYNMAGEIVAEITGLHMRPVTPKTIWENRYKKISYEVCWQAYPDQKIPEPDVAQPGCWLLLADESGVAEKLSREIQASEDEDIVVFANKNQTHSTTWTVSDFEDLFRNDIIPRSMPCKGIVFMWPLDAPDTDEAASDLIEQITRSNYLTLLHLLRANISSGLEAPGLYIVTRNTQLVTPGDRAACVTNSIFWGVGKVILHEHPEVHHVCIDLDFQGTADEGKLLWHHLQLMDDEHEIAFRDSQKLVSRLVRTTSLNREYPDNDSSIFNSDATYIITGGFGGMGIETARWLVKNNAAGIVLLGRHSPSASALESIQEIRDAGVEVLSRQVNIGDWESLSNALHDIRTSMPAIKGVFHLAGVLGEGDIMRQDIRDMEPVMVPKMEGAWHLHCLTLNDPLDHFVMFSSITSLWGGHGLGAYSASNMFLDILASHRKALGLPALSVNWGAFSGKGMIAKDDAGAKLRAKAGIDAFTPREALAHLFTAMGLKNHHICLAKIRWPDFFSHGYLGNNKLFAYLAIESTVPETVPANRGSEFLSRFTVSSINEQHDLLENLLKQKVSETLRIAKTDLATHTDLIQMGMDSLIFLELSQSLGKELEVQIPPHTLFKEPTIKGLTNNILEIIGKEKDTGAKGDVTKYFALRTDPANRFEPFELTDIQQAYWVGRHGVMGMGKIACHTYYELDISDLDMARYTQAWNTLIKRHEMLRVIFLPDGRQQILEKVPEFEIDISDFTGQDSDTVNSQLASIRERMSHQIFQTDEWPLFEVNVSLLNEKTSRVHMSLDLLFADAHSIRRIFYELHTFYNDPESAPDKPDISFRDYVISERKFRESVLYNAAKTYWCNRLETLPKAPELPVIRQLQDIDNPYFKRRIRTIGAKKWAGLKQHASRTGITPAGLLLSAYAKILSQWSRTNRFSINLTVFNRLAVHPRINEIIGDFTSVMFLEVDDSQHLSFNEFTAQIQNQLWRDMEHRFFSGVEFLRELAQARANPSMEIMPVVFTSNLIGDTSPRDTSPGEENIFSLVDKAVYGISQTPQVWIDLQVAETNGELVIFLDAVEDLFPQGMLDDMFAAYGKLLDILSTDEKTWSQATFRLLPDYQVQKRTEVNATKSGISGSLLHELFEKQALKYPDHVAVATSDCSVTYGQLSRFSNQLGYQLQHNGAEQNSLVAVVMEKGWEQVAAVLGILKSGAAYLPVDPDVPVERLRHLLKDGEVRWVLTQPWLDQDLEWPDNVNRFVVDMHDNSSLDAIPDQTGRSPEDLAYVIYTSGSTGLPKGVMIDHKGAVNTILDINSRYHLTRRDRVFALSNLNFDLSVYDIFGTLAAGATIVMPDDALHKDPGHWLSMIKEEHVTVWNSVPALMQMLVEYVSARDEFNFDTLRLILLSGDWIPLDLPDKIRTQFDPAGIISLGGATEASIWSILYPVNTVDLNWNSIPYGRPMVNQNFYVLDDTMAPCPDWVPGQLYIGGTGLAKGYWRDEEKTKASFIQDPKTGIPLYRTGDLGRFLPDGNIEFLGREDQQVKINGYRIELGEIEAAMEQYPGVKRAVANVAADTDNKQRIVGYVVTNGEIGISGDDLVQFLGKKLPAHMIPGAVIELNSLPLTPNGKIDRKNLPLPDPEERSVKSEYYPPENELELQLAGTIQEILKIDKISTRDLFLSIGANSLDMVKIQNALVKELKIDISVVDIFEHSSVHSLSRFISGKTEEQAGSLQVQGKVSARKAAALKRRKKRECAL